AVTGSGPGRPRPGKDLAGYLVQLPDMPEGEAAQPRPHRGGGHHPVAEHPCGRPCPQQLHVVDAVGAHGQRVHQRQQLASGASRTGPVAETDQLVGGPLNPQPLGKGRGQEQPSAGDRPGVIEGDIDLVQDDMGGSHRKGASYSGRMAGLAAAILPGQEALFTIQTGSTHHRNGGSRLSTAGGTSTTWPPNAAGGDTPRTPGKFNRMIWEIMSPEWHFSDETYDQTAQAFDNPDHVEIVIHNYRWRQSLALGGATNKRD